MAVDGWDLCLGMWETLTMKPVRNLAWILWYGNDHGRMAYRVKSMDVEKLVELWTETVVQLSTCHTHAERTEADARTDDLLGPILTAPIAEVRRFAELLADRLETDERVPFLIWS
ncbi:MAG: hypothetical protein MJA29_07405, partial [Candidatus Omnitrophica bacterium]|nr:hypothetical protein [Candidatus Omnitrophota bacterium]